MDDAKVLGLLFFIVGIVLLWFQEIGVKIIGTILSFIGIFVKQFAKK